MTRFPLTLALAALIASSAAAQRHKLATINAETPEGKLVQTFGAETDSAKKIELMEKFMSEFPKHEAAPWVMTQLQAEYLKAGNADKALATGEALLAVDPDDLDAAYANLKAAEKKQDADAIIRWSAATAAAARKQAAAAKPADVEQDEWKRAADYAAQVNTYSEYALSAAALQAADPAKALALGDALEQRNANSQYVQQMLGKYAAAARQANQVDKAAAFGERALARNQASDDMLLLMMESAMNRQQHAKVQGYAGQLVELMKSQAKPDGVADADWQKKKDASMGAAFWFQGVSLASESKFADADKALRNALPLIKDNSYLLAGATFYLGLANYKMAQSGKNNQMILDALRFSRQSAAIKGPFQGQAAKNVKVIQTEYHVK